MGTRGPVPKRSDQRRRRNADSRPQTVEIAGRGQVEVPRARTQLCARARKWYASLAESGQARFFEASDWQYALLVAEAIDAFMRKPSAMMLSSIDSMMGQLLVTEGARRRHRLELTDAAGSDDVDVADIVDMDDFRDLVG